MFIAGFAVADLLQRVRERLLAMERVPQHERDRLLVALVDTNWNMSKATQKLQRWPAVRSALLPSAQRLPAVRSREWNRSSLLAPAFRFLGDAPFLLRPLLSGEAFRIISPPQEDLVRRELAEAIENVFETFARTCGATREKPLEIRLARGFQRGSPRHGEGPALEILAVGGKALRAWREEWDKAMEAAEQISNADEKDQATASEQKRNLGFALYKALQKHGDWRENRGGWHPIAASRSCSVRGPQRKGRGRRCKGAKQPENSDKDYCIYHVPHGDYTYSDSDIQTSGFTAWWKEIADDPRSYQGL